MKILHITTIVEWRGGDSQMLTTYNLMSEYDNIEQFILCPTGSVLSEKIKNSDVKFFTASRKSKFSLQFLREIKRIIKNENISIVHVHDSNAFSLTLLALKKFPEVKLIYSRKRNNRISNNYFKKLKYNHPRINKIVCVSDAVKEVFRPILKSMDHVITIYDGIDVQKFQNKQSQNILHKEYGLDNDTIVIANIASLTDQKDIYTFIDTAAKIVQNTDKEIHFFVIGDGELRDELTAYKKSKQLDNKITFTGFRNDIAEILPEIDILLMSSIVEGLPLTIYEAFATRVPVVSTNAGGIGEAIEHKETGMICSIKDADSLAEHTLELLNTPDLVKRITDNGNTLVNERFTLEVMKSNYYKMYSDVSRSKR